MLVRQTTNPIEERIAAASSRERGRRRVDRPRVNRNHIPVPATTAVPTAVSATNEGGREVIRTPPLTKKSAKAPTIPHENSQRRARRACRRVGAGACFTDARTRLLKSGDRANGAPSKRQASRRGRHLQQVSHFGFLDLRRPRRRVTLCRHGGCTSCGCLR